MDKLTEKYSLKNGYIRKHITNNRFLHYLIQVGKGKGSYKTRYKSTLQTQALLYYRGINVGNGYKKRLVEVYEDCKNIVFREFS